MRGLFDENLVVESMASRPLEGPAPRAGLPGAGAGAAEAGGRAEEVQRRLEL